MQYNHKLWLQQEYSCQYVLTELMIGRSNTFGNPRPSLLSDVGLEEAVSASFCHSHPLRASGWPAVQRRGITLNRVWTFAGSLFSFALWTTKCNMMNTFQETLFANTHRCHHIQMVLHLFSPRGDKTTHHARSLQPCWWFCETVLGQSSALS